MRIADGMKEDGLLKGVWAIDGKIFVKTSPEGRPIRINTEDDLNNL